MTALRRSVEGWMGDDLYRKLGDEPKVEMTWGLLRELVGQQLLGDEYVSVPFIESAVYFNQLFVFTKKKSFWNTLGFKKPTYKIVGNLDYLVDRETSTWVPQFDFTPWDVADGMNMYREYHLRVSSNRTGTEKAIEVTVMESHPRSAVPPTSDSLSIHTNLIEDLIGVRNLYVITEVVFASFFKLSVKIGDSRKSIVYEQDTPIGFKYKKFKIRSNGTFENEMPTSMRLTDREAEWLQPLDQPLPTVPRWDTMRRRRCGEGVESGRRKMRNNLTIPTPEEPGRPRRTRGQWMQDGGNVIRVDRGNNNGPVLQARDVIAIHNNAMQEELNLERIRLRPAHVRRG